MTSTLENVDDLKRVHVVRHYVIFAILPQEARGSWFIPRVIKFPSQFFFECVGVCGVQWGIAGWAVTPQ